MERPDFDVGGAGRLLAEAFAVNSNSDCNKRAILRWYPGASRQVPVIYNGAAVEDGGARDWAPPDLPRPFILCAARLAEYKGLDILVMAFAELAERFPSVHLALC